MTQTKKKPVQARTDSWTEFVDNLRLADQLLIRPRVQSSQGMRADAYLGSALDRADLWLTPKVVEGFDPAEFADLPERERHALAAEVSEFLEIAEKVLPDKPAKSAQSRQARKHLEAVIKIVGGSLLREWTQALERLVAGVASTAKEKGWYVEMDQKGITESLLHVYKAPRLRIRTLDKEAFLDPVCRFGSGRSGVVDLVVMPTYETLYYITFKSGDWEIAAARGTSHRRPFTPATFVNTIARLPHR